MNYLLSPSKITSIKIHMEVGWATLPWKLNKRDKFYDAAAATCASCDALIDLPMHCVLYSVLSPVWLYGPDDYNQCQCLPM